jgi:hypothetical protein
MVVKPGTTINSTTNASLTLITNSVDGQVVGASNTPNIAINGASIKLSGMIKISSYENVLIQNSLIKSGNLSVSSTAASAGGIFISSINGNVTIDHSDIIFKGLLSDAVSLSVLPTINISLGYSGYSESTGSTGIYVQNDSHILSTGNIFFSSPPTILTWPWPFPYPSA